MFVCPQCQFDNPPVNKFCQECGCSLTHLTCPTCAAAVPLHDLRCACGTVTGVTWWAVIATTGTATQPFPTPVDPTAAIGWLDAHHRYQVLAPLVPSPAGGLEGVVLDCQPLQKSPLLALFGAVALADSPAAKAEALTAALIPSNAQAYLALRSAIVPPIHDAWRQGEQEILLLADRSTLPSLRDWPGADEATLEQMVAWLNVILDLWVALEPWHCRQSVLVVENLRLAGSELRLQRLYNDLTPPTLDQLGESWQQIFGDRAAGQSSSLITLFSELQAGKIKHLNEVRSQLQAIALLPTAAPTNTPPAKTLRSPLITVNSIQTDPSSAMMSDPPAMSPMPSDLPPTAASSITETAVSMSPDPGLPDPDELPDAAAALPVAAPTELEGVTILESDHDNDSDDMPTVVLPMQLFSLEDAGRTDIGRQREHNEDNFGIETQVIKSEQPSGKSVRARGLYILCDGMGGHAGGEVASALAVDTLKHYFQLYWQNTPLVGAPGQVTSQLPSADVIRDAIQQANKAIYDVNQQAARSGSGRMGTTLVVALVHDTEVAIAHVGDSRLYRYTRKYGLEQLTIDHEVGQREIQRGVDRTIAYGRPDAYQLTQALGPRNEDFIQPDIQFLELNEDTLFLIASDGLTDNDLLEVHCQTHVDPMMSSQMNLDKGVSQLIDLANEHNGHDNITAIAIRAKVRPNLEHLR
jgi:protein phosphatase